MGRDVAMGEGQGALRSGRQRADANGTLRGVLDMGNNVRRLSTRLGERLPGKSGGRRLDPDGSTEHAGFMSDRIARTQRTGIAWLGPMRT